MKNVALMKKAKTTKRKKENQKGERILARSFVIQTKTGQRFIFPSKVIQTKTGQVWIFPTKKDAAAARKLFSEWPKEKS